MKRAIYIAGITLFASFLLILMDDFNQEWKRTQEHFTQITENVYHSTAGGEFVFMPGIRQIVSEGLGRVDRCVTCHLGIDDPRYREAQQPFRSHPGELLKSHAIKRFGCSSCHLGQGFAVSYANAAHEKLPYWNEAMLPRELIQASCGTCHLSEEVPQAGILTRGRLLIKDKGCTGCHEINAFFEEVKRGPDLSGLGNKVLRPWLYNWLKNPQSYLNAPRMPSFTLDEEQLSALVEYLMSFDDKASPPVVVAGIPTEEGDEDHGKILVSESRCISCHTIHDRGGKLAPELERVGDKVREDWIANFLRNVHYYQPSKTMLEYNFSDQDALDIAAFVFEEYSEEEYELPEDSETAQRKSPSQQQALIDAGRKLFQRLGCDGCHETPESARAVRVGPKLDALGDRLESKLDFGSHDDVIETLYNWIFMKLKDPRSFDTTSVMPQYYLSDLEAFEITVALLGNKRSAYATEFLVPESSSSVYKKPAGEFGELFTRYSCISCHSIDAYGGTLSTVPLTIEGSRVRFEWLKSYLIKPYAIRPLLTERMPRFRMTEREAALMADYIKRVYVSDEIPRYFELELDGNGTADGRRLFDSLGCVNCHIIDGKGGYVGPDLDDVGSRLEAGWIYEWLKRPLRYRPETIHPDYGLTNEQSRNLAAFLLTRKRAS